MADFTELRKALSPFIPLFPFRRDLSNFLNRIHSEAGGSQLAKDRRIRSWQSHV